MITVIKQDHVGREVWRYTGTALQRGSTWVKLEAFFNRADVVTDYHTFRQGDRFIEWFFSDRWYSIFEMHDVEDDHLTGWYCNISRPAVITGDIISADDLALDLFVAPDGATRVLDEDEFATLPLDTYTRTHARQALDELLEMAADGLRPFSTLA